MLEREREELTTRFFAYGDGLEGYRDRVAPFIFDYTKKMNVQLRGNDEAIAEYRQRFMDTMSFVSRNFPWGFRRVENGTVTPRTRFESIAIGSYLALRERPDLLTRTVRVESWLNGEEFASITRSDGANAAAKLKARIYFVRDHLLEAIS